jgi:hypothetical protein
MIEYVWAWRHKSKLPTQNVMPLEVLQRNIILFRFLLVSKDLDMWRIANKAWFHHDNPTLPNYPQLFPTFSYL